MIANGTDNLVSWIRHNKLKNWSLARKNNLKENAIVWSSNPDVDFDANVEDMLSTLECLDGGNVYIISRDKGSVNNAGECWRVPEKCVAEQPINGFQPVQPVQPAVPIGYVSHEELDQRIDDAVKRVQFENAQKLFEQERSDFKKEVKEFENTRDGIIGTLLQKVAPIIEPYLQRLATPRVAGLDNQGQTPVDPIPVATVPQTESEADFDVFDEDESERLYAACEQWKCADAHDYLQLLEKIAKFAESGKEVKVFGMSFGYDKVKSMLLDLEID